MTRIVHPKGPTGLRDLDAKPAPKQRQPMPRKSVKRYENAPGRMFVSEVLRGFARGRECQMKSEWCSGDNATVCLCHSRRRTGTGDGQKPHDFWGYHGCAECHANEHLIEDRELYDAIRRTQWAVYAHFGTMTPE